MHSSANLAARAARALIVSAGFFAAAGSAFADPVTLMWDRNPETDVAGYVVYVGTASRTYTKSYNVGNATGFVFPDAVAGKLYYFAVSAYNDASVSSPKSAEVSGFSNAPPALLAPANQTATVGQRVSLQLSGSDPYGEPVSYRASGLPAGLTLAASTGLIAGAPTTAGTYTVTATATDGVLSATQSFTWTVSKPVVPPPPTPSPTPAPPTSTPSTGDRTPPRLIITAPTSLTLTVTSTSNLFKLSGTATDATAIVSVNWRNNLIGTGTASGTSSWAATVPLKRGTNYIAITARDVAGNSATLTRTVVYNPPVQ